MSNSKKINLRKFFHAFVIAFGIFYIFLAFFAGKSFAASGKPIPGLSMPCNETGDPEFGSLRPYQAAPCGDADKALFCSNDLQFVETFNNKWCNRPNGPEGSFICNIPNSGAPVSQGGGYVAPHTLTVNLANSQLAILGNTELTQNSQNTSDKIDDATKMSEYVSWYLGGVNNRAEYGDTKNTNDNIINFSGPIQKIMPQAILEAQRIAVVDTASRTTTYTPEDYDGGTAAVKSVKELENHNQIVVCTRGGSQIILSWLSNFLGIGQIGKEIPTNCYPSSGSKATGDLVLRLLDWKNSSITQEAVNFLTNYVNIPIFSQILAYSGASDRWSHNSPPLPWDDGTGKPFATEVEYQKAYNEWRGQVCSYVPNLLNLSQKKLVCSGSLIPITNPYADLFSYIPLANTTDKHGSETDLVGVVFQPTGGTQISGQTFNIPRSAPLFFSHAEEDMELSSLLNKSYVPKGVVGQPVPKTTGVNNCSLVDVRVNPGDNLFPGQPHGVEVPGVSYTITQAPCTTVKNVVPNIDPKTHRAIGFTTSYSTTCDAEIILTLPTFIKAPQVKEIWNTTTSDSESTFRRIYPEVGPGAPVSCIEDNPTKTGVTYTPIDPIGDGAKNFKVIGIGGGNTTADPSLYFPHIGSIYDYFLKGIQQALRPKGYGEGTPQSGKDCTTSPACGTLPDLPKTSGSCGLGSVSSSVGNIPQSLKDIINAAAQTYQTPPNLILGIMYGEGLFDGSNKKDWTDDNVKNWATCEPVPGCSPTGDDKLMGFNGNDFANITPHIIGDIQKLDPTRKTLSQCNLLDAIYAEAYNLHASASGGGGLPQSCFGIPLNSTIPNSCSWSPSQYEAAIKVSETGYTNACLTLKGGCAIGGGLSAACPNGDTCEHVGNSGNTSHNACIWNVAHGN